MLRLTQKQRHFFDLVRQAVRANPFSQKREAIDRSIAGFFNASREEALMRTTHEVAQRMQKLSDNKEGHLKSYGESDADLLRYAHLFHLFHHHMDDFDAHIEAQGRAGATPISFSAAEEILARLASAGFSPKEALKSLALIFQLRRAFYFIDRSLPGQSKAMVALREDLWNNVFTCDIELYGTWLTDRMEDFSTLLLGETGTGKGSAARAIGRSGHIPFNPKTGCFTESFAASFVPVNLSQYSEALVESELFGHTQGAFTGAIKNHQGLLEACSPHGAVFLDEIGEVSPGLQIKLLKVLEERAFSPVGSRKTLTFSGRIIAATNRPEKELLAKGHMREDLFYRLCSDLIVMPPLRERLKETPEELFSLVQFTVARIVGKPSPKLSEMVTQAIFQDPGANYPWPGNVRELAQCVRRTLLKRRYTPQNRTPPTQEPPTFAHEMASGDLTAAQLLQAYCHHLWMQHGNIGEVARKTGLDRRTAKKHIDGYLDAQQKQA